MNQSSRPRPRPREAVSTNRGEGREVMAGDQQHTAEPRLLNLFIFNSSYGQREGHVSIRDESVGM